MKVRVLSGKDVKAAITMAEAIEAVAQAFAQLSMGKASVPLRTSVETEQGVSLFMPAHLPDSESTALKVVSVYPDNRSLGLPTIMAMVVVVDGRTGRPLAVMDGTYLTALRTGAASGVATDLLAREDAQIVALFGAGVQGRTQLEAVCTVRGIEEIRVFDINQGASQKLVAEMAGQGLVPENVLVANSRREAVRGADIVVTATTSHSPVFDGRDIAPGTHINGIGSYTPEMREVDEKVVERAKIVVDSREGCLAEAGDLIIPIEAGLITETDIYAELGEIVAGAKPGRESRQEITFFKSVGNAVQDAAVAWKALERAEKKGLGAVVEL
jgi:alanine dehydrogenase